MMETLGSASPACSYTFGLVCFKFVRAFRPFASGIGRSCLKPGGGDLSHADT